MPNNGSNISARCSLYIEKLSKNRRKVYSVLTILLSSLGYMYFLLFPVTFIVSICLLVDLIQGVKSVSDWIWVGLASFIAAISVYVCFYSFKITFQQVQGLKISMNVAPGLCDVIQEVRSHYRRPLIEHIVITDQYEIRLECIPRMGVPILFSNTLVIGLPLLQSLSPDEFRCELSRCIGRHSGMVPGLTSFIYRSRNLWRVYRQTLEKDTRPDFLLLRLFFVPYSRLIDLIAIPAVRQDELIADTCAMDFVDENIMLDTLKSESIARAFLKLHYWTSVRSMAIRDPGTKIRPFAKLEKVLETLSTLESRKKWLNYAYNEERLPGETMPVLRERMEGIGHVKIRSIPGPEASAAKKYLGENKEQIVDIIDKLWCTTTLARGLKE